MQNYNAGSEKCFLIVGRLSLGVGLTATCGARLDMEQNRNNLLQ